MEYVDDLEYWLRRIKLEVTGEGRRMVDNALELCGNIRAEQEIQRMYEVAESERVE